LALQLSDTLCYNVKSKSEEAEFSRAIVSILSISLEAQAHITKQSKAMHVKCEQIGVLFGEKTVEQNLILDKERKSLRCQPSWTLHSNIVIAMIIVEHL